MPRNAIASPSSWEIDDNRTSPTGLDNFTADYLPSSSFVAITTVPEPSMLVLIAAGAVMEHVSDGQDARRHWSGTGGHIRAPPAAILSGPRPPLWISR